MMEAPNTSSTTNDTATVPKDRTGDDGFPPIIRHIYVAYYIVVFLMATIGNLFALLTCYKHFKQSTTVLLAYIASLAVADLLFTLFTPVDLSAFLAGAWVCGEFVCRFQSFLIESSYTASVLTLAAISHERLTAVSTPLLARSRRLTQRKLVPVVIWIISIASCSPLLYAYVIVTDSESIQQCVNIKWGDQGRQVYYSVQGVLIFLCPLAYMIYAHCQIFTLLKKHSISRKEMASMPRSASHSETRNQRKIGKMLVVVTCIFVASYFPFMLIRTLKYFYLFNADMVWRLVQLMIFTQAAVNPVVYCFYSKQFRAVFKDLMKCHWNTIHHRSEMSYKARTRSSSLEACGPIRLEPLNGGSGQSTPVLNPKVGLISRPHHRLPHIPPHHHTHPSKEQNGKE